MNEVVTIGTATAGGITACVVWPCAMPLRICQPVLRLPCRCREGLVVTLVESERALIPDCVRAAHPASANASVAGRPTAPGTGSWPTSSSTPMLSAQSTGRSWAWIPRPCGLTSTRPGREEGGWPGETLGRSRGGLTTKVHLAGDGQGRPLAFTITADNVNDCTRFEHVMARIEPRAPGGRRSQ